MTQFAVGQTGAAKFRDGMWQPSEPPTLKEQAERAGAGGDGSTLLFSHPMTPGHTYPLHEKVDVLGNKTLHLFSKREGPTGINPKGPLTTDAANAIKAKAAYQAEVAHNNSVSDHIREYWRAREIK